MSNSSQSNFHKGSDSSHLEAENGPRYGPSDSFGHRVLNSDLEQGIDSDEHAPAAYIPEDEEVHRLPTVSRQPSVLERILTSYSFFNEKLKERHRWLVWKFAGIYLIMGVCILSIFSIYWGSMYGRNGRLHNLQMLVVIEDENEIDGVQPLIGNSIRQLLETPQAKKLGTWNIYNTLQWQQMAAKNGNNATAEIERQIHHQKFWLSIYVHPNATYNLVSAINASDTSYPVVNNSISSIYETGRDFLSMNQYVTPGIQKIERMWLQKQANISATLIGQANASDHAAWEVASTPIGFNYIDRIPYTDPVLVAPSQVGLIYLVILTFFNLNFFGDIHATVARERIKTYQFVAYRLASSMLSYFVLSLFFSLVTLAMQVDFTVAFGKAGFLVYWMSSFLTMWVLGQVNEVAAMLIIPFYAPLVGFWLLFWVIVNITPTFTPLALSAKFFRYGYAMPVHSSYEISKVIFFDTYKGTLGRDFGILVAWLVIFLAISVPVCVWFTRTMGKKARAAAQAAAQAAQAQSQEKR